MLRTTAAHIDLRAGRLRFLQMATTLRITLLAGTYGFHHPAAVAVDGKATERLDYPPSPWRLLHTLLQADPALSPIVLLLARQPPSYHLPYGQTGGQAQGPGGSPNLLKFPAGTAIHISWPQQLSAEQERLLSATLAGLHCLGRSQDTAIWQVVPSMPTFNCLPDADGSLAVLCATPLEAPEPAEQSLLSPRWVRYRFTPSRLQPRSDTAAPLQANRALYAVASDPPLPASAGIVWTDRLHRALLKLAPGSWLFSGLVSGQPLPEDQRAWYRWQSSHAVISLLEVFSPQPFDAAELQALQRLQALFGRGGLRITLHMLQLDAVPVASARRLRTATPMLLYAVPRPGKPHRSPAAQAIQSLLWGLGEQGKRDSSSFQPLEGEHSVWLEHAHYGRISASTKAAASEMPLVVSRGDRRAACVQGYHVQLQADQPLPLLGVGWGRHFGAGRLVPAGD